MTPSRTSADGGAGTRLPLFGDEHDALRAMARTFVAREISPNVEAWERAEDFPRGLFATVGDAGLFGLKFAERWGGSGPDLLAEAVWVQELGRAASGGLAADLAAHAQRALLHVDVAGTDAQKQRYLEPGVSGQRLGAVAIAEPGVGRDLEAIATRAQRISTGWLLDGRKSPVTNGAWCDWVVVAARTGAGGVTLFVVDTDAPGITRRRLRTLGWRSAHTAHMVFDRVAVPEDAVLGEVDGADRALARVTAWERLASSLGAVAAAEVALEGAIAYAQQRQAFGRPVARFQVWRHRFADLATAIASGKALAEHALRLHVAHRGGGRVDPDELVRVTAVAAMVAQRTACEVADEAVQVHGGYGYVMEFPAQRWWRDAWMGALAGGPQEITTREVAATLGLSG